MEPATKKQRFSNLSSTEIQLLIEKKDSENTRGQQRMLWQRFLYFKRYFAQRILAKGR